MSGLFSCPECTHELAVEDQAPGRLVSCPGCGTSVEVPFLPRASKPRRFRARRRPAWVPWAWGGVATLAALLVLVGAGRLVRGRVRAMEEGRLAAVLAEVDASERSGRLDRALSEIEAALRLEFASGGGPDAAGRAELARRRDDLSRREATARLASAESGASDPALAAGDLEALRRRARVDPALAGLAARIERGLASARSRQARRELDAAALALAGGRPAEALADADAARLAVEALAGPEADSLRAEARALVVRAVARAGVVVEPIRGQYRIGSQVDYNAAMLPPLDEAMRAHGYLPRPGPGQPGAAWADIWDARAPFRVALEVVEHQEGLYLQSQNHTTRIDLRLTLTDRGRTAWPLAISARTREALLDMPQYVASRLGTAGRRNPEDERVLHRDAFLRLVELFTARVRTMPPRAG